MRSCKANTLAYALAMIGLFLTVSSCVGGYMLYSITEDGLADGVTTRGPGKYKWQLSPVYMRWALVLVFIPVSAVILVIIVAVKIVCYYVADNK